MSKTPAHRLTHARMANHWEHVADECDGKLHPWTEWCHKPERAASEIISSCVGQRI
jgi:hypothetical protein